MKEIAIFFILMYGLVPVFAQNDLMERLEVRAVEIDSLKKILIAEKSYIKKLHHEKDSLKMKIKIMNSKIDSLKKNGEENEVTINSLNIKVDSIAYFKAELKDRANQLNVSKQNAVKKEKEGFENGKASILKELFKEYENKSLDELIRDYHKQTNQQLLMMLAESSSKKSNLSYLQMYFEARELLDRKFDESKINSALDNLTQISKKENSESVKNLIKQVEVYKNLNDGLKQVLVDLVKLDNEDSVNDLPEEVITKKKNKIWDIISSFIFNYDFKFMDYPYLSGIITELIKLKVPNPDADINYLKNKL